MFSLMKSDGCSVCVGGVEISFIVIVALVHFHGRGEAATLNPARHGARVNAAIALAD